MNKLRLAVSSDFERILELEHKCFGENEMVSKNGLKWRMDNFPEHTMVIEENNKVVAYISYIFSNEFCVDDRYFSDEVADSKIGKYCIIIGVATDPEYQKKGYSAKLIKEFLKSVNKPIILTCHEYLIDFYKHFGFKLVNVASSSFNGATWYNMTYNTDIMPSR